MKVVLVSAWFGPDGQIRNPGEYDLPEHFRELLPPTAQAEEAPKDEVKKTEKKISL